MASNHDFTIKNGLTIGSSRVIAANGQWVGVSSGLIGPQGPAGKPYKIVDVTDIPSDRIFRNAWEYQE